MTTEDLSRLAAIAREVAERAGRVVLGIYASAEGTDAQLKGDGSPLTRADLASHQVIVDGLRAAVPEWPVLSEEGVDVPEATRIGWTRNWLIDPLDGTKEFLARNGEFTVNVALIEAADGVGRPVLGVVHVPVTGVTYVGIPNMGAWRHDADGRTRITAAPPEGTVRIVASRSHGNPATDAFIAGLAAHFGEVERTSSGSSLKLCRVAEGSAHYYPRVAPTMAWDTAAAQAVAEAAGAVVWRYGSRKALHYDARALRNPPFLVAYAADAPLPAAYGPLEDA